MTARTKAQRKRDNKLRKLRHKNVPRWRYCLKKASDRCIYKSTNSYERYGGRGIKCFLTPVEALRLWFRDVGWMMEDPTLDRINPDGHYEFNNCRFLERLENCRNVRSPGMVPDEDVI